MPHFGRQSRYLFPILLILFAIFLHRQAMAQEIGFNPKMCNNNVDNKLYISEGLKVFGIDPADMVLRGSIPLPSRDQLTPPDPSEQLGCLNNPKQFAYFMMPLNAVFPGAREALSIAGFKINTFGITPLNGYGLSALNKRSQVSRPTWFADDPEFTEWVGKKQDSECKNDEDVVICRYPARGAEPATSFAVSPKLYSTPAGKPFRVFCGIDAYITGLSPCRIGSYAILNDLGVFYSFTPLTSVRKNDFISRVIVFDTALRKAILGAVINEYSWPATNKAANSKERVEQ